MEGPRLAVELELQLPAYTTAIATRDPSHVCNLHRSSWQHRILNPQSKARDQTRILMESSWLRNCTEPTQKVLLTVFCLLLSDHAFKTGSTSEPPLLPLDLGGTVSVGQAFFPSVCCGRYCEASWCWMWANLRLP